MQPAPRHELEPNDTVAAAEALGPVGAEAVTVAATLGAGDRDHYRIRIVGEPHLLEVSLDGPPADVAVLHPDGRVLASSRAPDAVRGLGVVAGALLIRVSAGGAGADAYRLRVAASPWRRGLEWEPNDDEARPDEMAPAIPGPGKLAEHRVSGWWSDAGDRDCFALPLAVPPEGALLRIVLAPPPSVIPGLTVFAKQAGKAGPALVQARGGRGEPLILPALGARSWTLAYILCVAGESNAPSPAPYLLQASLQPADAPFEFEPNDDLAQASALPPGIAVAGFLPTGDVDLYRISAQTRSQRAIRVAVPEGHEVELLLLDEAGRELARGAPERSGVLRARHPTPAFARLRALGLGRVDRTYEVVLED
jgi:hypothetical protein